MTRLHFRTATTTLLSLSILVLSGGAANALSASTETHASTAASTSAKQSATDQQHLATIISKGNAEITRRLTSLNGLSSKIAATKKLTSSDQASLTSEVTSEISGLTSLKTKLDAETQLSAAITDAQSIFSGYRVYALILPKVRLVVTADNQQDVETKLTTLYTKLQTRVSKSTNATIQADLATMNQDTTAAQTISSSVEASVINLQPTDYDSDHTILSGDASKLQTAHTDNQAALTEAKTIIAGLKS